MNIERRITRSARSQRTFTFTHIALIYLHCLWTLHLTLSSDSTRLNTLHFCQTAECLYKRKKNCGNFTCVMCSSTHTHSVRTRWMVCNSKLVIIYSERFRQQILITLRFICLSWASYVHAPCVTSVDERVYTGQKINVSTTTLPIYTDLWTALLRKSLEWKRQ